VKQAVGRILRETKGKQNHPVIYDIVDHWSVLFAMWQKRLNMYRESGFACEKEPEQKLQGCLFI
jgi:superfamily II DNA or RNA helicase